MEKYSKIKKSSVRSGVRLADDYNRQVQEETDTFNVIWGERIKRKRKECNPQLQNRIVIKQATDDGEKIK